MDQPGPAVDEFELPVRSWLESFVVDLNLCPFARPLLGADQLRISICRDVDPLQLRKAFLAELDLLQRSSEAEIATTVLVFPLALGDFEDYLDFLDLARELVLESGLDGLVQLASFHPRYLFEGEPEAAASHYSNRAPYPAIHLLREDMLGRVLVDYPAPEEIPLRNIRTLDEIGVAELERRWRALFTP